MNDVTIGEAGPQMNVTYGDVRVEWVNLGEGHHGDYNPDDPDDCNLLRFDVLVTSDTATRYELSGEPVNPDDPHGWFAPQDASYCTRVPADAAVETLATLAAEVAVQVGQALEERRSVKRACETMSWMVA